MQTQTDRHISVPKEKNIWDWCSLTSRKKGTQPRRCTYTRCRAAKREGCSPDLLLNYVRLWWCTCLPALSINSCRQTNSSAYCASRRPTGRVLPCPWCGTLCRTTLQHLGIWCCSTSSIRTLWTISSKEWGKNYVLSWTDARGRLTVQCLSWWSWFIWCFC